MCDNIGMKSGQFGRSSLEDRMQDKLTDVRDYWTPYKLGRPVLAPSGETDSFDCYGVGAMRLIRHNDRVYRFYPGFVLRPV